MKDKSESEDICDIEVSRKKSNLRPRNAKKGGGGCNYIRAKLGKKETWDAPGTEKAEAALVGKFGSCEEETSELRNGVYKKRRQPPLFLFLICSIHPKAAYKGIGHRLDIAARCEQSREESI